MLIAAHIEKFQRLDAMLQRLDVETDRELWIWTAMNAATHLLNAALHHASLTLPTDSFHSQVEGLYSMPNRSDGALTDAMHTPGDVMHFGQPPLGRPAPAAIERAGAALKILEDLREPYVRGEDSAPAGAPEGWTRAYRECIADLSAVLDMPVRAGA
ncbi:MAG: hypothetical protein ABIP49_03785 [Lysobacterales bacterium]